MYEAVRAAQSFIDSSHQHYIITPNPEIVLLAWKNRRYRAVLNKASLSIPDGTGLVWASKRLYGEQCLKERVAGVDFIQKFLSHMSFESYTTNKTYRTLLLGGRENSAHIASRILQKKFSNLKFYALGNEKSRHLKFIINEMIKPDCIFIALGAPNQELWISRNLEKFPTVKFAMGIGGAFDMIAGRTPRAPRAFQKIGAEWLWRLFIEPWRIARIFRAVMVFPAIIIKNRYF